MKFKKTSKPKVEVKVPTLLEEVSAVIERVQLGEYSSKVPFERTVWGYDLAAQDIAAVFARHGYKKAPEGASMALDDLLDDLA